MADVHGSPGDGMQMPAVSGSGSEPVPYTGPGVSTEPPTYSVPAFTDAGGATSAVLAGVSGNALQESAYAHDVNAGLVAPFVSGVPQVIYVGGDADAGGRDDVAGTVAGAVANAEARWHELAGDQGSHIGDDMTVPPVPEDATPPDSDFLWATGDQPGKGTPRQEEVG
jgi:hypothetical protein